MNELQSTSVAETVVATDTSTSISLQEWIRRVTANTITSQENYLECAINVALKLVNYLCLVVGKSGNPQNDNSLSSLNYDPFGINGGIGIDDNIPSMSQMQVQLRDIVSQSILVNIASASELTCIQSVEIFPSSQEDDLDALFDFPELSSQDACGALGRVFFELFTRGKVKDFFHATPDNIPSNKSKDDDDFNDSQLSFQDLFLDDDGKGDDDGEFTSSFRDLLVDSFGENGTDSFSDLLTSDNDNGRNCRKRSNSIPAVAISNNSNNNSNSNNSKNPVKKGSLSKQTEKMSHQSKPTRAKLLLQERGLPLSICRLVSDLLESDSSAGNDFGERLTADSAITNIREAREELIQMFQHPHRFLYDRTTKSKVWDDTGLFRQDQEEEKVAELFGREEETKMLLKMAERVGAIATTMRNVGGVVDRGVANFMCEAAFVGGHSGSGKSSIVKRVLSLYQSEWFVVTCKFDRQQPPLATIARSFNDFFEGVLLRSNESNATVVSSLDLISISISSRLDSDGLSQLCELCPVFMKIFPLVVTEQLMMQDTTSTIGVGSGRNRLRYLFQIVITAILSEGGHPVLIFLDDLQWSDGFALDVVSDVFQTATYSEGDQSESSHNEFQGGGLFLIGTYRDNEVDASTLRQIQEMDNRAGNIKVTQLSIGALSGQDINMMLAFKLGMPTRYTKDLAAVVLTKTRGNPMFVLSFLRSIISRGHLSYSMRSRSWEWDDCTLDVLSMSEDVAQFVAQGLGRLDRDVLMACQICACLGFQVDTPVLELMDIGQFVPDLICASDSAVKEGILDKEGPTYSFSHDMLRESAYATIPLKERNALHKKIAESLVQEPSVADNAELCTLAVDQINICKDVDGILDPLEKVIFAKLNLAAGKHAIKSSSYEQARGYFEAGISLLRQNHWEKLYSLSLELYEMVCVVSFMDGTLDDNVSTRLDEILSNAKSFEDTWKAKELELKMHASRGQYVKSTTKCLAVLSELGIHFPDDINLSIVANEVSGTSSLLQDVTKDFLLNLPPMTDLSRLCAMKFMCILCNVTLFAKPMMCHLTSALMLKEALLYGFFEEAVYGLANFSRALMHVTAQYTEANRIGLLAQSFLVGHKNEHALRVRFPLLIHVSAGVLWEPGQSIPVHCMNGYQSGMIVGDIENSMMCGFLVCQSRFHTSSELKALQGTCCNFIRQMVKHNQLGVMNSTLCIYATCAALTGEKHDNSCGLGIKTIKELTTTANQTNNMFLLHHIYLNRMFIHFYFREYTQLLEIADAHKLLKEKRVMNFLRVFFVGISSLSLARDTHQKHYREFGEQAVEIFVPLVNFSKHNFETKLFLLQAELHYLNGNHGEAEVAYENSIESSRKYKFKNDEAVAHELYGIFLVERNMFDRGMLHLSTSLSKYRDWGAELKVKEVISFMEGLFTAKTTWNNKYRQII